MVEAMVGETPLMLQVQDECPDFMMSDLGHSRGDSLRSKEMVEIIGAAGDNGNGIRAFAFRSGTKLIPCDMTLQCCRWYCYHLVPLQNLTKQEVFSTKHPGLSSGLGQDFVSILGIQAVFCLL